MCKTEGWGVDEVTYLRVDSLGVFPITAEEINALFVKTVSRNDSAIDMDWEVNI
jgi:hypothetical protein